MPEPKKRKPQDAVVGNVKMLRAEVRVLQKTVANEARYSLKEFKRLDRDRYLLEQRVLQLSPGAVLRGRR